MLTPDDKKISPVSERELELISQVTGLREALRDTLNHLGAELQPSLAPKMATYRSLVDQTQPETGVEAVSAGELFELVTAMAHFLSQTSSHEMFSRHGPSGLVDWAILMSLTHAHPGLTDRQIARHIGANYKRVQRRTQALAEAGLIRLTPVEATVAMTVEVAPAGQARLDEVDAAVVPLLAWFTQRHRFRLMLAARQTRLLSRMYDERGGRKKPPPKPM